MKNLAFYLLFFWATIAVNAQQWASSAGGSATSNDIAYAVCADANGNSYVTGMIGSGTATFGSYTLTADCNFVPFVAKYNSSGTCQWAVKVDSTCYGEVSGGHGICVDGSGNVYVTGIFNHHGVFGSISLTSPSYSTVFFVAKLNSSGQWQWATSYDLGASSGTGSGHGISADGSGNILVTGVFGGNQAIFGSTTLYASNGTTFVAKINSSGTWQWALNCTANNPQGIAVDASGNAYITGYFGSTATFGSTTLTSSGNDDVFTAKCNSSGWLWAQSGGASGIERARAISIDGSGNTYITGVFDAETMSFGSYSITGTGSSAYNLFVVKYNSSGAVQWAQAVSNARGQGIKTDASGNSYITGPYTGTATFGSTSFTSSGSSDVFLVKMNSSGSIIDALSGGGTSNDYSYGVGIDGSGNQYVAGTYSGTATYGSTQLTSQGAGDIFIFKNGNAPTNPTLTLSAPSGGQQWCAGTSHAITWNASNFSNVKIELSSDGGNTFPTVLASSVSANSGSWSWNIPSSQTPGTQYKIRVSNADSTALNSISAMNFTVLGAPIITTQPTPQSACAGASASFTIAASSASGIQWFKIGSSLPLASGSTYTISMVTQAHEGVYYAVATGCSQSVQSDTVRLSVKRQPVLSQQPQPQFVCVGGGATFSALASGTGTLAYQWRKNGQAIAGATLPSYTIASVTVSDVGSYSVIVTGDCFLTQSNSAD